MAVVIPEVGIVTRAFGIVTVGAEVYAEPTLVTVIAVTEPPEIVAVAAAEDPPPPDQYASISKHSTV